jgi:hypothetical protein
LRAVADPSREPDADDDGDVDEEITRGVAAAARRRRRTAPAREAVEAGSVVVGHGARGDRRGLAGLLAALASAIAAASLLVDPGHALKLGLSAMAAGIGSVMLGAAASRVVQVAVDASRALVTLATDDGGQVDLPLASIERFSSVRHTHTSSRSGSTSQRETTVTWRVVAEKRDGGQIETYACPSGGEEEARQVVAQLEAALAAARERPAPDIDPSTAAASLGDIPRLRVATPRTRGEGYRSGPARDALEVSWDAPPPWRQTLGFLGLVGGFAQVFHAFSLSPGNGAAIVGTYFMAAMALAIVVFTGLAVGVTVHVRIDDESFEVTRRRFGQPISSRRWPIHEIEAIDFSVTSSTSTLSVRASGEEPAPEVDPEGPSLAFVAAVARHASQLNQLPLGELTLADGLRLDLALSAEVARRRDVDPHTL